MNFKTQYLFIQFFNIFNYFIYNTDLFSFTQLLIEVDSILPLCLRESHEERQVWAVAVSDAGQLYRASAAVGARNGRAAATVSLASSSVARLALDRLTKGRDGLIVKFFFHDARQLFFHVILQEFNEWIKTDFLVHDGHTAL